VFHEIPDFLNQKSFVFSKAVQRACGNLKGDKATSSKDTIFKHRFSVSASREYIRIYSSLFISFGGIFTKDNKGVRITGKVTTEGEYN